MLIDEADCHKTWCPRASVSIVDGNADVGIELASSCNRIVRVAVGQEPQVHYVPIGACCIGRLCGVWRAHPAMPQRGYCGIGGMPVELALALEPRMEGGEPPLANYANGGAS